MPYAVLHSSVTSLRLSKSQMCSHLLHGGREILLRRVVVEFLRRV